MERIAAEGHIHFDEVPAEVQRVFVTSHDIAPEWHVRMQAAFQHHVDSAISKTTNFPFEATEEQVLEIYELAYRLGCKGVTVYRDGSRPMQVLSTGKTQNAESTEAPAEMTAELDALELERAGLEQQLADSRAELHGYRVKLEQVTREQEESDHDAAAARRKRQRPPMLTGRTMKANSPLGDIYVTINQDQTGRPFEVFCTLGKAGGAAMADSEAIGRLISLGLRSGVPITAVKDQLRGISCDRAVGVGPNKVLSAPDAIAQAIERYLAEKEGVQEVLPIDAPSLAVGSGAAAAAAPSVKGPEPAFLGTCSQCGSGQLAFEEGCKKCYICGFSECG
jgi:ribonucleoside-diphosphate reductase alpha chain